MEVANGDLLPLSVPLSASHRARFATIVAEIAGLEARRIEAVQAIVGTQHDPIALANAGWTFALTSDAIVCNPPARSDDA